MRNYVSQLEETYLIIFYKESIAELTQKLVYSHSIFRQCYYSVFNYYYLDVCKNVI